MTIDELKKKIVEIFSPYVAERWHEHITDAIIAAGLTFDKTTAILAERTNSKTLIHKAQYYDEMKLRAEVAERALSNELVQQGIRIGVFDVRTWYYQALERAEIELEEEGEDDRRGKD